MINLKDYRQNPQKYIIWAKDKMVEVDRKLFDMTDAQLRALKWKQEAMLKQRNDLSKEIDVKRKAWEDFQALVQQVKWLKEELNGITTQIEELQKTFDDLVLRIPNPPLDDVPVGTEDDNVVIKKVGEKRNYDFTPKTHRELLEAKGYLDTERGVKLSWSRFVIVRWKLAELQLALQNRVVQKLVKKGFEFTFVPQLVREDAMRTTGFLPNDAMNLYRVNPKVLHPNPLLEGEGNLEGEGDKTQNFPWEPDDLRLIGTAEVALISQHMNETLDASELPKRYVWFSSCYRREAGTYGKDMKGLIRLHQFEKVEMVSFVKPEDAEKEHELLFAIENEIFSELWLHYQQILIASGDLGAPAAKKYDLEAWFPGIWAYKEVTSTSNTTDFQTRRGMIKYKEDGKKDFVYSLNGTAVALGRALACIVETYQTAEGDIEVPEVLRPWMRDDKI